MTTKREQILAKVATTLQNTTGVNNRIYRSRVEAMARAETPALVIEYVSDEAEMKGSLSYLNWTLLIRITVVTRGQIPDQYADITVESIHSKLLADITLNGLVFDIIPLRFEFDVLDTDLPTGITMLFYKVKYRTLLNSL